MKFLPPVMTFSIGENKSHALIRVCGCSSCGCKLAGCLGFHDKQQRDFQCGREYSKTDLLKLLEYLNDEKTTGLTILGGEPMEQENQQGIAEIVREIRGKFGQNKSIVIYTGYVLEKDLDPTRSKWYPDTTDYILQNIDALIDGPFIEEDFDVSRKFACSRNQRIIHLKDGVPVKIE